MFEDLHESTLGEGNFTSSSSFPGTRRGNIYLQSGVLDVLAKARRRRSLRRERHTTGAILKLVCTLDPSAASPLSRRRAPPHPSCRTCGASGGIALSGRESLPIIFLGGRADNPETKTTKAERSGASTCATTTSPDLVPGRSQ
ncbi:hypothetical protein RHGRI_034667 [Rhododendron griersonianum]|uniref:Uncharacterized protein n=1 Tax=Rhododendron griersonianum TaxID=479676 RepID=A0AAV6I639_9ERIC|nr:hypothetical protein RHGRI_034667 [Rhododendron griersonianum]